MLLHVQEHLMVSAQVLECSTIMFAYQGRLLLRQALVPLSVIRPIRVQTLRLWIPTLPWVWVDTWDYYWSGQMWFERSRLWEVGWQSSRHAYIR